MTTDNKIFDYILIGLLGLSALLCVLFFAEVISEGVIISWCYLLFAAAAIAAVAFPIIQMVKHPAEAKNALIGVGGLLLIFVIGYALASGEEYINYEGKLLADESMSRLSEAGLIAFYLLGAGAIGTIVYAEVNKMLK